MRLCDRVGVCIFISGRQNATKQILDLDEELSNPFLLRQVISVSSNGTLCLSVCRTIKCAGFTLRHIEWDVKGMSECFLCKGLCSYCILHVKTL